MNITGCTWAIKRKCNDCEKYCSISNKISIGWTEREIRRFYKLTDYLFEAAMKEIRG